jgi:glycosyltransferase involved in cell wall biosynthesis
VLPWRKAINWLSLDEPRKKASGEMPTPIVFGVLLQNAREKWLGRNQLMLSLSRHTPVVLLEHSAPSKGITGSRRPQAERLADNLFMVKDAFALRTHRIGKRVGRIAALLDGKWLNDALAEVGIRNYIYWLTVNDQKLTWGIPSERLIYDCMDPNFLPETQAEFDRSEFAIGRRARLVFCSAHSLHRRMLSVNENSFLLPNAAALDTCRACDSGSGELPVGLRNRKRPFIGYMGTLDWRFDSDCVYAAASALEDCTFVLVGRVNPDQEERIKRLRDLPNVLVTGQVSYEDGHAYNAAFDVGIIPFIPTIMNDAINPVKMFMYLVTGKPVVSTWIEECRRNSLVIAARSEEEFVQAIRNAVEHNDAAHVQARMVFARANTWEHRAEEAISHLRTAGLYR